MADHITKNGWRTAEVSWDHAPERGRWICTWRTHTVGGVKILAEDDPPVRWSRRHGRPVPRLYDDEPARVNIHRARG